METPLERIEKNALEYASQFDGKDIKIAASEDYKSGAITAHNIVVDDILTMHQELLLIDPIPANIVQIAKKFADIHTRTLALKIK